MKSSSLLCLLGCAGLFAIAALAPVPADACPFCSAPSMTLTEQLTGADTAVLVKWVSGKPAKLSDAGSTEFEVVEVVHQDGGGKLKPGSKLDLIRFRTGKPGDLFLLLGTLGGQNIEWGSPLEVSKAGFEYMKNSPKPDQPAVKRLSYFLKYLENPDQMISDDAFGEFANAAYSDVVQLSKDLPREKLRTWLTTNSVSPGRIGLYGMMLGLCGTDEDTALMERKIFDGKEDFRLGIDGVMGGYLLLAREKGLALLEEKKLKDKSAPFSETYAAMQAVRFMWTYGDNRISQERLRQSMRILLERPELTDLVIADLARMKDWSVQDKLIEMYDAEAYSLPSIKRAIVRFTLAAMKDTGHKKEEATGGAGSSTEVPVEAIPAHVAKAKKCLEDLEAKDPKTVQEARRFFQIK